MIMKDPWMPSKSLRSFDLKLHKFRGSCSSYHCRQRITINREAIGERLWAFRICCWIRKQSMPEFHVLHYRANQQDTNILLVAVLANRILDNNLSCWVCHQQILLVIWFWPLIDTICLYIELGNYSPPCFLCWYVKCQSWMFYQLRVMQGFSKQQGGNGTSRKTSRTYVQLGTP